MTILIYRRPNTKTIWLYAIDRTEIGLKLKEITADEALELKLYSTESVGYTFR